MAVVAVTGDNLVVALLDAFLHAHGHGFLANVQVAEPADQAHAVQLPRLFLESTDQQHVLVVFQKFIRRDV